MTALLLLHQTLVCIRSILYQLGVIMNAHATARSDLMLTGNDLEAINQVVVEVIKGVNNRTSS